MRIRVGQVFRVEHPGVRDNRTALDDFPSYYNLTRGTHNVGADINKGIWAYKQVDEPGVPFKRRPAVLLHSNPLKEDSLDVPWIDVVEPDKGYAIYNGDNRREGALPLSARGNALLTDLAPFYSDPKLRQYAPPILLFTQRLIGGNRRGFREFSGYGIPTRYIVQSQAARGQDSHFTNLVVELALFSLDQENEFLDWRWIDLRRQANRTIGETQHAAPAAWKLWVNHGEDVIERCRRRIAKNQVISVAEQLSYPPEDKSLLTEVVDFFGPNRYAFEGLACLVAQRVLGTDCVRGWVTKRSGDGGIDFVCRLDVGSAFSRASMVVLGQAKCTGIHTAVNCRDLARVVARLQRGWLGVYVTTGVFSESAQKELHCDKYPVVLINGKRLTRELRLIMNMENINLQELLNRERGWYEDNIEPVAPERIVDQTMFGSSMRITP